MKLFTSRIHQYWQLCMLCFVVAFSVCLPWRSLTAQTVNPVNDQFSVFELSMDKIADQYGKDESAVLKHLQPLEKQIRNSLDFSTLAAYRCYLTKQTKQPLLFQSILKELQAKVGDDPFKSTVQAAIELCSMYAEEDVQKRDENLARAFHFVKDSPAPTLRYWISTMYVELTNRQGRARDAIDAAKIALRVARANQDRHRQAVSLRSLALVEVDFGDKEEALAHIDEALAIQNALSNDSADTETMLNRAYILTSLKRYDEAIKAYREVEMIAYKQKEMTIPPIVWSNYADIAYAQGDYQLAQKEVNRLLDWAEKNQNVFLGSFAKVTNALLLIEHRKPEQAQQVFSEALVFFQKEKRQVEMRDFYGSLAIAFERNGYYKLAYEALEKKLELSARIDQESRGHAANELRELLKTEERVKENFRLQAEIEKNRLSMQRWIFLALLLLIALAWSAKLFLQTRKRNSALLVENKELDYQRFQDPLTQLLNRRYVMENRATIWQAILQQNAAMMIIDADHFKRINDNYGHPAGDAALIEIARRIQLNVRDSDIVVRWGGEEFLICSFSCNAEQAGMMAGRILAELRSAPMEFDGKQLRLSASIGYVLMPMQWRPNAQVSLEESIKFADAALYLAKAKGRNRALGIEKISSSAGELAPLFDHLDEAAAQGDIQVKEIVGADFP
jgi:diguanylate cyclase (GGDEF)-like protein